ncbi:MAG: dockerin type I domain-containing protein, partial [Planctomycetota bacterium]|nr:dockerin type I domain-containing protein [Planctomycetota bacterium]
DGQPQPHVTTWLAPRPVFVESGPTPHGGPAACTTFLSTDSPPDGDLPRDLEFTPDGSAVVIVNRNTDNLTFFDVATQTITHTVAIGDFPVDVAVTPDGQFAVAPNVFDNSVAIVDIPTHTLLENVPITGDQPFQVKVTSDSKFAIVGVINDGIASSFSVIDLVARTEVRSFASASQGVMGFFFTPEVGIGGNIFTQFALSSDNVKVVLPDRSTNQVFVYDLTNGTQLSVLPTADLPTSVDISADGATAVVGHEGATKTVSEIDLNALAVTGSFLTANNLGSQVIRITPDKSHAIAAISNNVIFVNLTTGLTTATISTGVVGDIEISFDGQYAFVSNFNARVIDIASRTLVDTIQFAACADAATSPVEHRAVALNNRFREDIHLYNTNGPAGFFEGFTGSGQPPEGDSSRDLAISADGQTLVACNIISRNVSIIDVPTTEVRSIVEVGDRPRAVEITPDGTHAVVCAMDSHQVVVIDLATDTAVATLPIFNRPAQVRISPDSQFAYVLNVAGADRVSFISLNGAASFIMSQLSAGQTGSVGLNLSGVELTADGSIFAVCDSFNDLLRLYDTALQTQVAAVPVGDFPIRVDFSPDGSKAYVTNAFGDSVSVVVVNGAASFVQATVSFIDFPIPINVDSTGSFVYVGGTGASPGIRVIDTASNTIVAAALFPSGVPLDTHLSPLDSILYVSGSNSEMLRIAAAGPATAIVDSTPLSAAAPDMVFHDATGVAAFGHPGLDGVEFAAHVTPGDLNDDGTVDELDVPIFVQVLLSGPTSFTARCAADVNGDEITNGGDISPFLALLLVP